MIKDINLRRAISEEEIDLKKFINLFIRNKNKISLITLIFFLIAFALSISLRKVWEGKFQIVLSNQKSNPLSSSLLSSNANLLRIAGIDLGDKASALPTEVGILKSSSVLMPIFDYVKNYKSEKDINYNKSFTDWKKDNLKIELKEDTSILDIKYKDRDKKLIISVLNKMSNTYQIYSGKNKKRNLQLTKKYLEDQIQIYKKESSESLRKLQEYAIDKDLLLIDNINSFDNSNSLNLSNSSISFNSQESFEKRRNQFGFQNIGIGYSRVKAANRLKNIDFKINKIKELNDVEQLRYIGLTIPNFIESGIPQKLEELDSRLLKARSKYTEDDIAVKILIEEKNELIKSLKQTYLGLLKADKIYSQGILESATRPKEVLLKYKMLLRDANGDELTLAELENQLRIISLQEAKTEDPWELISVPNIKKYPHFPNKIFFSLLGICFGILFGILYSFFKERKSGLIFEESDLLNITNAKIIEIFSSKDNKFKSYSNKIFNEEILMVDPKESIQIINKTNLSDITLKEKFNFIFEKKNVFIKEIFDIYENNEKIILITKIGTISFDDIHSIINRLNILNKNLFGVILLD